MTAPGPSARRRLMYLIGLVVLALILVNALAARILPEIATSREAGRNPYRFRGYPEYLAGLADDPDRRDLVLISNSQAYAGELPTSHIYPTRLQRLLNESDTATRPPWRVHNWAVDGVTSMEYLLMATALRGQSPELVIASIGYADFKGRNAEEGFSHCRTDLPRLAGRPSIARALPAAFWRRHGRVEDVLEAIAQDHLPIVRLPEYLWSYLDQLYPGMQPLFYAPAVYYHPWDLHLTPRRSKVQIARQPPSETGLNYYAYDERSTVLLTEFLVALQQVDAARLLVVACPGNPRPGSRHEESIRRFREDAARLTARQGIAFIDLSEALPHADFIDSLHFNARNHRRYAEALQQAIASGGER